MPRQRQRVRRIGALAPAALMPVGALAVHELRFWLAFGSHASQAMAGQGHAYLHSVAPWIVLSLGLVLGGFTRSLGRAWAGERSLTRYSVSLLGLWLACTVALLAIYAAQETLEGLFATGHPLGWAGIVGFGGWWAVPAAACVGLVLAAAYHGARWVLGTVARRAQTRRGRRGAPPLLAAVPAPVRPVAGPVAGGWSGRGPPLRAPAAPAH